MCVWRAKRAGWRAECGAFGGCVLGDGLARCVVLCCVVLCCVECGELSVERGGFD